jgi:hypothetical protein
MPSSQDSDGSLIVPGTRVGTLAIGDPVGKIFRLFPKPSIGGPSDEAPACGAGYLIGLLQDAKHPGFLRVFTKDGKVIQIEAEGAHFHTAEGIGSNSSPEDVRLHYKGLQSYLFLGGTNEALNMGPLVLWTGKEKGIAFSFAYPSRGDSRFFVSGIIVFKPGASFCEQDTILPDPQSWHKLSPYSFGPSDTNGATASTEKLFLHVGQVLQSSELP